MEDLPLKANLEPYIKCGLPHHRNLNKSVPFCGWCFSEFKGEAHRGVMHKLDAAAYTKGRRMISGTKEWANHNVNICKGCSHNCRYCFARSMAVRFNRKTVENWHIDEIEQEKVTKPYRKLEGTIMFPTSHDITPAILEQCFTVLEKMLKAGNEVLVVGKPHLECIKRLCQRLIDYSEQILFRFTIGAQNEALLKFWEPGAPSYGERLNSLKYAFDNGFQTSISIEPMLDSENIELLVKDLQPFVTNAIWIGKMNQIRVRVAVDGPDTDQAIKRIEEGQIDERIRQIYATLKDHPHIKWKDSVKAVIGPEVSKEPKPNKRPPWLKDCEICNAGLCSTMDRLKAEGKSEREAAKTMEQEAVQIIGAKVWTAQQIRARYIYIILESRLVEILPLMEKKNRTSAKAKQKRSETKRQSLTRPLSNF
jgi:DNA repair photolyase